ncbi:MAG: 50S ribosomal protein L2, large subunit ribosomal protein L2 [Candidatus Peregrinibacteria bacterium GW2011_GWE2_39_6]|nr:MAG: 50S ribosomal protein L2, large subunit ribosomal protein L2 [Candidatus Peregrinibacteria bacterium GW2011_GWF2_39_17]KKR26536.1 MAG: 50S ribosomal protein L2, large subunit ribosomal protein L2 [Candidatus Peregrinibacteria bacterium GW2011_GWE2_39_6]
MPIKIVKNTTPARRQMSVSTFEEVTTKKPLKSLVVSQKRRSGRNNTGRITIRHRGGGVKRSYRLIDFKQTDNKGVEGAVASVEYDPNRNSYIMLVVYKNGDKKYHLAPEKIKVGDKIMANDKTKIRSGNRCLIGNIPVGFTIYNIELQPGRGGQIVRSAGANAKLISVEGAMAQVQLPSGEIRFIPKTNFASIGVVSNLDHSNISWGKAGRNRWKGKRPQVRGKAMNPCDHPHGGGEGNTSIGLKFPKTPWGLPALGVKTRKRKSKTNIYRIRDRHGKNFIKTT